MVSVIVVCGISSMVAASLHLFLSPSVSTHSAACQQKRQEDDAARKQRCKTTTLKLEQKLEEMETKDEEKLAALYKALLGGISGKVQVAEAPCPDLKVTPQKDCSVTPRRMVAGTPLAAHAGAGCPLLLSIGKTSPKNLFGIGMLPSPFAACPRRSTWFTSFHHERKSPVVLH